jgi:non-heme Fe2+,alpha-ketoglutarate-dependent halogenase
MSATATLALRRLSPEQVATYHRDGLIQPLEAFTPAEAAANRVAFDRLMADFRAHGRDSYAINGYHSSCASIARIACDPRILDAVEDLIGPDFVAWGTHYFCKMPGDGRIVDWHQDAPYWPLAPTGTVTAWVAIDDADVGNASMRYILGSHRLGEVSRRPSLPEERNVLGEAIDRAEELGRVGHHRLRAGQFALHADMLVHGSVANTSARRRCGLTIRYAPVSVRSSKGWNTNSFLVRGRDPAGYWADKPRPVGDSVEGRPIVMGAN